MASHQPPRLIPRANQRIFDVTGEHRDSRQARARSQPNPNSFVSNLLLITKSFRLAVVALQLVHSTLSSSGQGQPPQPDLESLIAQAEEPEKDGEKDGLAERQIHRDREDPRPADVHRGR
jgi:hypothetical protein